MQFIDTKLEGCIQIKSEIFKDDRGSFLKLYNEKLFQQNISDLEIREQFYTISHKNVLRGMHFQLPPYEHKKLVSCLSGEVLDVVLDLRKDSKTFGQVESFHLTPDNGKIVLIPKGMAHGFLSLTDNCGMLYSTSTVHAPKFDTGIHWDSFDYLWPCDEPIISERDQKHLAFLEFESPFR